jgi:DMSO/TMAO reductase YedYZ heme-binding membrane subunit
LGLGIAATELLLALAIVNRLRDKLSYRFWRRAHYLNFAVWVGSTLHGVLTGTDSLVPLYAAALAFVAAAVGLRLASGGNAPRTTTAAEARDVRRRDRVARRTAGTGRASVG